MILLMKLNYLNALEWLVVRTLKILKEAAAFTGISVICDEISVLGRVELLNYLQEQSISNNYHRFGYIG